MTPDVMVRVVLASFLRLVTGPKIFQSATPIEDAMAFVDAPWLRLMCSSRPWARSDRSFDSYVSTSN